jgi:hypothetical protein
MQGPWETEIDLSDCITSMTCFVFLLEVSGFLYLTFVHNSLSHKCAGLCSGLSCFHFVAALMRCAPFQVDLGS